MWCRLMRSSVILKKIDKILIIFLAQIFFLNLDASHNASRYFPFLERPAEYVTKNTSHVSPSFFVTDASVAFGRGGGNAGIPELYGRYDLRDVISSLKKVKGSGYIDPIEKERGPADAWLDKSIMFKVNGKVKSTGLLLNYEQYVSFKGFNYKLNGVHLRNLNLKLNGITFGLSVPFMRVNAGNNFVFMPSTSDVVVHNLRSGELDQLNRIRRIVNDDLGVLGGDWVKVGPGDLDLHAALNYNWDHEWLMKSIDLNFRLGLTIPTAVNSDINYPSSVSFMGNGHWSMYLDVVPEFELKQDWKVGLMLSAIYQFDNSRSFRVPVYQEPAIFSALIFDSKTSPGMTFKFSPYFIAENLTDGIDFQVRYTYLRHNSDEQYDDRTGSFVKSYLNQTSGTQIWTDKNLTQEDINKNIDVKFDLTRWRMHYITLELLYDSKEAGNNWILDPKFFMTFDYQFSGNGSSKTHQLTLGIQAEF